MEFQTSQTLKINPEKFVPTSVNFSEPAIDKATWDHPIRSLVKNGELDIENISLELIKNWIDKPQAPKLSHNQITTAQVALIKLHQLGIFKMVPGSEITEITGDLLGKGKQNPLPIRENHGGSFAGIGSGKLLSAEERSALSTTLINWANLEEKALGFTNRDISGIVGPKSLKGLSNFIEEVGANPSPRKYDFSRLSSVKLSLSSANPETKKEPDPAIEPNSKAQQLLTDNLKDKEQAESTPNSLTTDSSPEAKAIAEPTPVATLATLESSSKTTSPTTTSSSNSTKLTVPLVGKLNEAIESDNELRETPHSLAKQTQNPNQLEAQKRQSSTPTVTRPYPKPKSNNALDTESLLENALNSPNRVETLAHNLKFALKRNQLNGRGEEVLETMMQLTPLEISQLNSKFPGGFRNLGQAGLAETLREAVGDEYAEKFRENIQWSRTQLSPEQLKSIPVTDSPPLDRSAAKAIGGLIDRNLKKIIDR